MIRIESSDPRMQELFDAALLAAIDIQGEYGEVPDDLGEALAKVAHCDSWEELEQMRKENNGKGE